MQKVTTHVFNASYLAIFLYGMRRIMQRIRPISLDDAYDFMNGLIKRPGEPIFLIHKDGTYYHIANAPAKQVSNVVGYFATLFGSDKTCRRTWASVSNASNASKPEKIAWNIHVTKLMPTEMQNRIPVIAQNLKKAYGETA